MFFLNLLNKKWVGSYWIILLEYWVPKRLWWQPSATQRSPCCAGFTIWFSRDYEEARNGKQKKNMGSPFPTNQFHGMTLQVLKAAHYLGMNQNLSYQMWMGWTSYCHTHRVTNQQFSRFHIGATPNKRRFASVRARVSASLWFWMSSAPCALPPRIREQWWWARLAARERWWEHLCRYQANL